MDSTMKIGERGIMTILLVHWKWHWYKTQSKLIVFWGELMQKKNSRDPKCLVANISRSGSKAKIYLRFWSPHRFLCLARKMFSKQDSPQFCKTCWYLFCHGLTILNDLNNWMSFFNFLFLKQRWQEEKSKTVIYIWAYIAYTQGKIVTFVREKGWKSVHSLLRMAEA